MILETKLNGRPSKRCALVACVGMFYAASCHHQHALIAVAMQVQARPGPSDNLEEFQNRVRMRAAKVQKEMREKQQEQQTQVFYYEKPALGAVVSFLSTVLTD